MYTSRRVKNLLITSKEEQRPLRGNRVCCQVFFQYVPVASFYKDDPASQKIAAVHLVESGLASKTDAAEIVGLHRNTISKTVRTKKLLGISKAIQDDRGRKYPIRYTPEIKAHIIILIENCPELTDTQIAKQATRDLKTEISRQAVARIRTGHFDPFSSLSPPSKKELTEIEIMIRRTEKQIGQLIQLTFSFENNSELKDKVVEFAEEPTPDGERSGDACFLSQLRKGIATPYAGLFFYQLFLSELNFSKLFEEFNLNDNKQYNACEISLAIVFGLANGLPSVEAHKLLNPSQFGPLFGVPKSPDLLTIRSYLNIMAEKNIADSIIDKFAIQVLRMRATDPQVFFVDGHFLPYYGLSLLSKGYHTVRRQILKGNEIYVVSDIKKRPLMFITEGCEIDFRPILHRIAEKLIEYGINRPLLVFDRGGYGVHFFSELSLKADFITWSKYVRNDELSSISDEEFTVGFRFLGKCYEISETEKDLTESAATAKKEGRVRRSRIKVRMIVIRRIDGKTYKEVGKRLAVLTSDKNREGWKIGYFMLNRWGKSENFFKEVTAIFNFDYHPGYAVSEMENQPLFDNPEVSIIKAAIRNLDKEISILEGKSAILQLEYQKEAKKKTTTKIEKLETEKKEKISDKEGFKGKLKELPAKVSLEHFLDKPMCHCDLEKKRLYDLMQMITYHSRERLVEEFRHCYNRPQDLKQILDKITDKGGYIRLIGSTLVILLDWIERPAHRKASEMLCQRINRLGIVMQGRLPLRLHFAVANFPLTGV